MKNKKKYNNYGLVIQVKNKDNYYYMENNDFAKKIEFAKIFDSEDDNILDIVKRYQKDKRKDVRIIKVKKNKKNNSVDIESDVTEHYKKLKLI